MSWNRSRVFDPYVPPPEHQVCAICSHHAPLFLVPTGPQVPGVMPPASTFERLCALCCRKLGRVL